MAIRLECCVRVPMRDGCQLNATLYMPGRMHSPGPCILTMTPYGWDDHHERAKYFAERGFLYAVVDVRGRGNSEGSFRPLIQEAHDACDAVEWAARSPLCNGKVAMKGGSYSGYCQWAAAKESPRGLATIVPIASPYPGIDFPMRNNVFYPYLLRWVAFTSGRARQSQLFADDAFWSDQFREWHESGESFEALFNRIGEVPTSVKEWLDHPHPDEFWDRFNPSEGQYAKIDIPTLTITGAYDDDQLGAMTHFAQSTAHAANRDRHFLLIGPWDHAATGAPRRSIGGLDFHEDSVIDVQSLHLSWYRWIMEGGEQPDLLRAPVTYYISGAERWSYAQELSEVTRHTERLFLSSFGNPNDVRSPGQLDPSPGRGGPDEYEYDTALLDGPEIEVEARSDGGSIVDQSVMVALTGRLLAYETAPFGYPRTISGFFRANLWLSLNRPDSDFYVTVHEVFSDGRVVRLSSDVMRARYRGGLRSATLVETTEPLQYDFNRFTFVARRIEAGHRLRLVLAPWGRPVDSIFTQRNFGGGGIVSKETVQQAGKARVRLFHDARHPSVLSVPIGECVDGL